MKSKLILREQELQQHLTKQYPKEDEACEWKEFKNFIMNFGRDFTPNCKVEGYATLGVRDSKVWG